MLSQFAGWLKAALQDPEVKAKLALQGLYPVGMCGDEFAAYVRKRFDDYGEMIREVQHHGAVGLICFELTPLTATPAARP